ncbi:hypothetical protein QFC22_001254 [Naganishia vaughanmartiniae]|uniref:Uncharacterized protein n=1 Tax=Naganishia vaughanmartiniae TaxID=1424756 RepID=A0ACC2XHI9_9TREE|nr:hypothetical protein QFC22_001254 [Naganishia vaughanmartiniae]
MVHRGASLCPPPPPLFNSSAINTDLPRFTSRFDLDKITHIISETWEIPERQLIEDHPRKNEIFTVTPMWHTRSRVLYLQDVNFYSPDPAKIFSGVFVSCLNDISESDVEQISATVGSFGGSYRQGVTQDVTHIITRKVEPYVFESADELPPIMRPEWLADPEKYPSQHMTNMLKQHGLVEKEQALGWGSVLSAEKMANGHISSTLKKDANLFEGKKIILGCQIEVSPDFRVAIESTVKAAGGDVLPEERMRDCDIYITPFREGKEYLRALKYGKIVGTLPWLNHVMKIGRMTAPKDNLLHYPVPRGGIPEFRPCTISVTNYTGEARDYLKRLISLMEGEFTTTLARDVNTHLIAATKSGEKVSRASTWGIPVMNHMYLEDCFTQWKRLPEAVDDRYTLFPHGVNYMSLLGNAKLTDKDLERWTAPAKDIDDDDDMQEIDGDITATGLAPPTQATSPSQHDRTARQEDAGGDVGEIDTGHVEMNAVIAPMEMDDGPGPVDMDADIEDAPFRSPSPARADSPPASPSNDNVRADPVATDEGEVDVHPPIEESYNLPPQEPELDEMIPEEPMDRESTVQRAESVSSPLSGHPEDDRDVVPAAVDDKVDDAVEDDLGRPMGGEHVQQAEEDVQMHSDVPDEPPAPPKSAKRAKVAVTRSQAEVDVVPTAQFKTRASTQAVKKTRSAVPTTTQPVKRRRMSTPEKETPKAAIQPVPEFQGRARRQAATKAADMLHNIIAPDMALHDKEKKRKDIVSPKSRREARVGGKGEGSSRKSKLDHEATDEEESTEDELETHLKAKGTPRSATAKKTPAATKGRSRSTIVRDTARTRLGSRSGSVLSMLSGEEEGDQTGDLKPPSVKLMTTGVTLEDRVIKILKSIGVKFTDKPLEMTHLICRTAIRTTKLLVGIGKGVDVLSADWLDKCVELRRMIDPEPFQLSDPTNEEKLGFSVAESVARSKALHREQGGLFAGKLFHITGQVKPGFDAIKDVVKAAGGDITRYISGKNRIPKHGQDPLILISCEEDKDIWQDLLADKENVVVHDKELVFTSILKMELDMTSHVLTI